ncbi:MAG: hypothetical protein J0I09_13615 [Sphingobacteriia bacterium]|nr:hypothetical protein [Sphingobacteriia bacterium]
MNQKDNTIFKNTLFLYFRMIVVTIVSLFTTRITLQILGVEDFGVFNVIAGLIGFLGMLNGAMVSATQRFLTFELGKGDINRYNKVFSMMLTVFWMLALIILFASVFAGNKIIEHFLVIPVQRQNIAKWLLLFSALSFILNLISIPYMSSIIAYERMSIYAYMSLIEVSLKLLFAYSLYISPLDKLLTYGGLNTLAIFMVTLGYIGYCYFKLNGCKFRFYWDKNLFKQLLSYIGWNLFGSITTILNFQGQAVILNIFFGPVVNAAKAIADKMNVIVASFSTNFYMAVRPRIIKSYAKGDYEYLYKLVYSSTKFSFYLLLIITLPLIVLMNKVLPIWLGAAQVTQEMIIFSQLVLVFSLVNVFEQPITVLIQATGNVKKYEIVIGSATLLFIPLCYIVFKCKAPAYYSMILLIVIYILAQWLRMFIAQRQVGLSIKYYCTHIFLPVAITAVPAYVLSRLFIKALPDTIVGTITCALVCFATTLGCVLLIGLNKTERAMLVNRVQGKILEKISFRLR